jgi:hypothetical protein
VYNCETYENLEASCVIAVNDKWRRTGISVELYELGFRVLAPGNLRPSELDEALDTLHGHVENLEKCSLQQLKTVFKVLTR